MRSGRCSDRGQRGTYDPRFNFDGKSTPLVLPPAHGLAQVKNETYTAEGPISYWNAYVAVTQMHGRGNFSDPRIGIEVRQEPDLVTPKLEALRAYQHAIAAPPTPGASYDRLAARRGKGVFAANCARCHVDGSLTDNNDGALHAPSETGMDSTYAARTSQKRYRTTPVRALWQHAPYFHDGAPGRCRTSSITTCGCAISSYGRPAPRPRRVSEVPVVERSPRSERMAMRRWILVVASFAVLARSRTLGAQRPIALGVAGGVSVPQGDLRDGANTGWHALGTLALGTLMQPLGLRLDVAYNRFAFSDRVRTSASEEGHQSVGSATLNASYRLPMTDSPISPYLIAGLGAYRSDCSLVSCAATTRVGWECRSRDEGAGAAVPDVHRGAISPDEQSGFVPVTVGVMM